MVLEGTTSGTIQLQLSRINKPIEVEHWCLCSEHLALMRLVGSTDASVEASLLKTALMLISKHLCSGEVSPSIDV